MRIYQAESIGKKMNFFKNVVHAKCFVTFLFLFGIVNATTYYVSTSGDNSKSGSIDAPWRNVNYAVNYSGLTGGDKVYIRNGTYSEHVVMTKSGSAGNVITVSNYTGETPVIDGNGLGTNSYNFSGVFEVRGSNVIVNGLKVINARWDKTCGGISVLGPGVTNVTIQYCSTNNTSSCGIGIWGNSADYSGCTNIIIQNNDISEAVVGGYQENLSISGGVDNFTIRYNIVHDSKNAPDPVNIPLGIDAKTNVRNGKIYNNHVYNLAYASGIYVDGYDKTAYNIDIYNNTVHNNGHAGIQIGAEQGGSVYNVNVYNNLVYNNAEHGFVIQSSSSVHDVKFYNNTVFGNGYNGSCILNENAKAITLKNNIFSQNTWSNSVVVYSGNKANADVSNNICDGVQNAYWAGTECFLGAGSITSSPLFVNAGSADFKLNSVSPAINAGTSSLAAATDIDGNVRPAGGGVDIGAYEFGATNQSAPVITGPASLSNCDTGTVLNVSFIASGSATITWSVSSGTLPPGMALNASTGVYSGTPTTIGTFSFTIKATNLLGNDTKNYSQIIQAIIPRFQGPYGGTARAVPGTIQAEDYDIGGEGVAYHDLTSGNDLGVYRTDSVDVEATTDVDGGYQLGHTGDGEWLEYTVSVATSGAYTLDARLASASAMQFHLYVDGIDIATVDAASTGSWTTWTTVTKSGISLTAGKHVIRFAFTSLGFCVNWLRFTGSTKIKPYLSNVAANPAMVNTAYYTLDGKKMTRAIAGSCPQLPIAGRQTSVRANKSGGSAGLYILQTK